MYVVVYLLYSCPDDKNDVVFLYCTMAPIICIPLSVIISSFVVSAAAVVVVAAVVVIVVVVVAAVVLDVCSSDVQILESVIVEFGGQHLSAKGASADQPIKKVRSYNHHGHHHRKYYHHLKEHHCM